MLKCALLTAALVVAAAEPVLVELKTFTCKPAFDGGDDLVKFNEDEGKIHFYTNGTITAPVKVPDEGKYELVVEASCDEAKNEKAKIKVKVGDTVVKESFELTTADQKEYSFPVALKKGETKVSIEFLNDEYKENEYDRNFYVYAVRLLKK